jgi:hypothetical protein
MKKTKITIFSLLLFAGMVQLNAQTTTPQKGTVSTDQKTSEKETTPQAVVHFKVQPLVNPFILKINELTEGDDVLTEKVIAQIQQSNSIIIKRVVSDSEFNSLSTELKQEAIKESEVIKIVNQLKK